MTSRRSTRRQLSTQSSQEMRDERDDESGILDAGKQESWDLDEIFSYKTLKIVRVQDKYIGALYWMITLVVLIYISYVVFYLEGKHAENAAGFGNIIVSVHGKGFVNGTKKIVDAADLRFPAIEPRGAFIATKRVILEQRHGRCVDMETLRSCDVHTPCPNHAHCNGEHCESFGWCPSLGDANALNPPVGAVVEHYMGLERLVLNIGTSIVFPVLSNRTFVAGTSDFGESARRFRNMTLGDLVALATPPITFEEAMDKGALLGLSFKWTCTLTQDCEPEVSVKHLDGGLGFVQKRGKRRRTNGAEARDAFYSWGVRITVDSVGVGRQADMLLIVVQVGSALALLRMGSVAADFLMLRTPKDYPYSQERRTLYEQNLIQETKDYSDLKDRLNLVQDSSNKESSDVLTANTDGTVGRGSSIALAIGCSGGSPDPIMRGRRPPQGASSSSRD
eukprot:TRINITY_DN55726_c0_g1_i1.p1 TRINITY_DN55726_c0_g1~~TRINITY_DN55726_c0_g1_i1.p1  ORF type:complete len:449 (-),score=41.39 TRINITY_DN55726_c0_g1_i1:39-1385(-)